MNGSASSFAFGALSFARPVIHGNIDTMKKSAAKNVLTASQEMNAKIAKFTDWRGPVLSRLRAIILQADPDIVEEMKWMGTPVFSHAGIVCTGETYKNVVKMTFAKGAALQDPSGLFNSSLDGNVRRAIDIHEGEKINEAALKDLIRAAVALNLQNLKAKSQPKPKPRPANSKPGRKMAGL